MIDKITSLNTPDAPLYCEECGDFLNGNANFTKLHKDGPYCHKCHEAAQDMEDEDNGQFGVGA